MAIYRFLRKKIKLKSAVKKKKKKKKKKKVREKSPHGGLHKAILEASMRGFFLNLRKSGTFVFFNGTYFPGQFPLSMFKGSEI